MAIAEPLTGGDDGAPILGAIFAGGAARRYGDDKALALLDGMALLQWVVDRAGPQVDILAISGHPRAGFSLPVIADEKPGAGPLAALCSVLAWAQARRFGWVATFSCDTPFVPRDMVENLRKAMGGRHCAVAYSGGVAHSTCALWRVSARARLETAFASGKRSLHGAIADMDAAAVDFPGAQDCPGGDPFFNINAQPDMTVAQAWLNRARSRP